MKKFIYILSLSFMASFSLTSCDPETNEEPGGTAVEKMAGYWDVNVYGVTDAGEPVIDFGPATIYTYNTVDNSSTKMWLDDQESFWAFKFGRKLSATHFLLPRHRLRCSRNRHCCGDRW